MDNFTDAKKTGRVAGFFYLIIILAGIFSIAYVPSQLFSSDDPSLTVQNIRSSEMLFRSGIAAGFICYLFFLVLPLVLYRLLNSINKTVAILMVVFAVISVPLSLGNLINLLDILSLINGAEHPVFSGVELQAQVSMHLDSYYNGILICKIFWGLWLLPFGYLVFKSGLIPKILGILLIMGCFGYLIDVLGQTLYPAYLETVISNYVTLPATFGEMGTCLWLLTVGIRKQ